MNNYIFMFSILVFCGIFLSEGAWPHYFFKINRFHHAFPNVIAALIAAGVNFIFIFIFLQGFVDWHKANNFGLFNNIEVSGFSKIFIAIFLFDFWMYIWHRLNHEFKPLWLLHRAHHNDTAMDVTTSLRFHPIEIIISSLLNIGVIFILGMSLEQFLFYNLVLQIIIFFHHSNISLSEKLDRFMRIVIVTPNMHRLHHSIIDYETNSNYSSVFSFWDRSFKTFRKNDPKRLIKFGLPYLRESKWHDFKGFLRIPFLKKI